MPLFLDLEFPRGMGDQVEKSWKFQGVGGVTWSPLEQKIQRGGGLNWHKPYVGSGYGYFLEPHNLRKLTEPSSDVLTNTSCKLQSTFLEEKRALNASYEVISSIKQYVDIRICV